MASAGHAASASRACRLHTVHAQNHATAFVRTAQRWRKHPADQYRFSEKRCIKLRAQSKSSSQLLSSEENEDGSILFCFGDPGTQAQTPKAEPAVGTQQQGAAVKQQSPTSTLSQDAAEPAHSVSSKQAHSSISHAESSQQAANLVAQQAAFALEQHVVEAAKVAVQAQASSVLDTSAKATLMPAADNKPPVASPAQQPAPLDIQHQANGRNSSADTSTTEESDSTSERLWDMSPQQLDNLKVAELKDLCKQEQVKGYSKLKKDELISLLKAELQSK